MVTPTIHLCMADTFNFIVPVTSTTHLRMADTFNHRSCLSPSTCTHTDECYHGEKKRECKKNNVPTISSDWTVLRSSYHWTYCQAANCEWYVREDDFVYWNLIQWELVNSISEQINPFKCQSSVCVCVCVRLRACIRVCVCESVCVCELRKLLVCLLTFVFSITVLWVFKYTICVTVYCDVVNVQPCFNFSEIIILNLEYPAR